MAKIERLTVDCERPYLKTHPQINFQLDLRRASYRFWMLLGEGQSKCQHIAGVPLEPASAYELYRVYLSKGVHATTSIEGNTLTEEQVQQIMDRKLKLPRSQEYLETEVRNIIRACNEIAQELQDNPAVKISPERILHFNSLVLADLEVEDYVIPGEFRKVPVGVMRYRAAPWEDCPYLIERLCEWLNGPDFEASEPEERFIKTILKATLAHLYIAWIHPFGDGNGRTARLIEFQLLIQSGLVPYPAGHLLSNHYNKTRSRYYVELDKSNRIDQGPVPFVEYAAEGFVDGLREQLKYIREQQFKVIWENYVHNQFHDKDTPAYRRQRHLVLDMPERVISRKEIVLVSPRVTLAYAGTGEKTLTRDLNSLQAMGLITRKKGGFEANRNVISAFLPPRCEEATDKDKGMLF